jgi:hypothetical protein
LKSLVENISKLISSSVLSFFSLILSSQGIRYSRKELICIIVAKSKPFILTGSQVCRVLPFSSYLFTTLSHSLALCISPLCLSSFLSLEARVTADFRGKLILVTLHVWLVNRRLLKLQNINSSILRLQETLFDRMWEYCAAVIKDLKVDRQQRSLEQAQYFAFYICNDLDEALGLMDEEKIIDVFGGIIWNKLYRREDLPEDHVMELAR